VFGPNLPSTVTPTIVCQSATSDPLLPCLIVACGALGSATGTAPTMPPTGTFTISFGASDCQVSCPATIVVGLWGLAARSESRDTPNFWEMRVGLSPTCATYCMIQRLLDFLPRVAA
jgi:hypothetical protein